MLPAQRLLARNNDYMVRTHSQFCWAAFANTRTTKCAIGGALEQLVWTMVGKVAPWNA